MSKEYICVFTAEQYAMVKDGLRYMKDMYEMRVREAQTGAFSPDSEAAERAARELEIVNEATEVCDNAAPYFKAP